MPWYVYYLQGANGRGSYIGKTNDLDRRLAQHNGQKAGGAKATRGRQWNRVCYVKGFSDERAALQFEWAWKYYTRRLRNTAAPLGSYKHRMEALLACLDADKVTSNASTMELEVVWESEVDPFEWV